MKYRIILSLLVLSACSASASFRQDPASDDATTEHVRPSMLDTANNVVCYQVGRYFPDMPMALSCVALPRRVED